MLTSRELAGNETWIAAMSWCECAFCGFLSRERELIRPAVPCPHCGKSGRPRLIFPDMASNRLLEMISHFYVQAWNRQEGHGAVLGHELSQRLGREYQPALAVKAALDLQRVQLESDGSQVAFERLLGVIRESLDLESTEAAHKVFVPLLEYRDRNEEHQVVVLLTVTMLEKLFQELLLRMLVKNGKDWEAARKKLRYLRHAEGERKFKTVAKTGLKEAIGSAGFPVFYGNWRDIREVRNKFMHRMPFVIRVADTEKAFEVAKVAFAMFAALRNQFGVTCEHHRTM